MHLHRRLPQASREQSSAPEIRRLKVTGLIKIRVSGRLKKLWLTFDGSGPFHNEDHRRYERSLL